MFIHFQPILIGSMNGIIAEVLHVLDSPHPLRSDLVINKLGKIAQTFLHGVISLEISRTSHFQIRPIRCVISQ